MSMWSVKLSGNTKKYRVKLSAFYIYNRAGLMQLTASSGFMHWKGYSPQTAKPAFNEFLFI